MIRTSSMGTILSSRGFLAIFFTATTARLCASFLILPPTSTSFAPDEAGYALLANWLATGAYYVSGNKADPNLLAATFSFIAPSSILVRINIDPIYAVRLISILSGSLSILVLGLCVVLIRQNYGKCELIQGKVFNKPDLLLISVFAFFPSNFLWSILGLRESTSQLWLLLAFFFFLKTLYSAPNFPMSSWLGLLVSIAFSFGARKETALLFSCILLLATLGKWQKSNRLVANVVIISGILSGQLLASNSIKLSSNADQLIVQNYRQPSSLEKLLETASTLDKTEYKRNVNREGADSALPESDCSSKLDSPQERITCTINEYPYRIIAFLFRPFPFVDIGSTNSNFASAENILWTLIYLSFVISLFRGSNKEIVKRIEFLIPFIFLIMFSSLAALYEGNLGTAFRHKSTILWILIVLIFQLRESRTRQSI